MQPTTQTVEPSELDFDIQFMWNYAVYGIDVSDVLYYELQALYWAIKGITTDFKTISNHSFDTSWPCALCAGVGHNFLDYPEQDADKVKQAHSCLHVALFPVHEFSQEG